MHVCYDKLLTSSWHPRFIPTTSTASEGPFVEAIQHWIEGKPTSGRSERTAPVYTPATGEHRADVVLASREDVHDAVESATRAFGTWSQSSLSQRTKILFAFRELVVRH